LPDLFPILTIRLANLTLVAQKERRHSTWVMDGGGTGQRTYRALHALKNVARTLSASIGRLSGSEIPNLRPGSSALDGDSRSTRKPLPSDSFGKMATSQFSSITSTMEFAALEDAVSLLDPWAVADGFGPVCRDPIRLQLVDVWTWFAI
jgi:hypothetical protein